ncbi:MAM and LDL-receptor class A domain-containing protein 1-like [Amphiura filiformis]|uniref:MAM and LDL-receptor class A domain-containing protein 1-like n=1 Tax=Amphiura filiformis TaxID=82378 RepID=UPI003B20CAF1
MMLYTLASGLYTIIMLIEVAYGYFTCNFENSVDRSCGFYNDTANGFNWKMDTAYIRKSFTRPTADHSYFNQSGHYVFIESSFPSSHGRMSRLLSPTVVIPSSSNTSTDLCLKFYYHMYGPPNQDLHVFVREHGENVPQYSHWNVSGNLGDTWHEHSIDMSINFGFQIVFQGTKGSQYHGDISLDDISVTRGQCIGIPVNATTTPATSTAASTLNEFVCNLEFNDICGFTKDTRNAFDWQWRGNSGQPTRGPLGDHTLGSSSGFYIFVSTDPNGQQEQELGSRIVSPLFSGNSARRCLRFFVSMRGSNLGRLNGYVMQNNYTPRLVPNWSFSTPTVNMWKQVFMDIPRQRYNYRVMFEVIRGKNFDGTVAIDDLILTNGVCPVISASCDFERGLGNFIQDTSDDKNWYLRRGGTPSYGTGPTNDHTLGTYGGSYLYLETSYGTTPGHVARLLSPVLMTTTKYPRCLTFWYHMYGANIATLNVYIVNGTDSNTHNILWSMSGNRGHKWRAAEVHLDSAVDFQVVFEAMQGDGYRGDIAIDDIKIVADVCPGEHHVHNYSSITCDFEEAEICYYEQENTADDIDWAWINGDSASHRLPVGPSTDHTLKNEIGFYLFVSYENAYGYYQFSHQSKKAWLKSPYASPQKSRSCVEFWYHMYGRNAENLKVFFQKQGEEIPATHAWKQSGDQGNFWHRATVDVGLVNVAFRVVFEATTGTTYQNDIAIDDVTFYNSTSCPTFVTEPPPPVTLPPTTNNASCNFDNYDICSYTQVINDNTDWSRRYRRRTWYGPSYDHTIGRDYYYRNSGQRGFYMNFDCYSSLRFDYRAQLATPYIAPNTEHQCMYFYYYMYGRGVDMLNIYLVSYGYTLTNDPQMSLFGNKGNYWNRGTLDLPPSSQPYQVIFEAVKGQIRYYCDIAIDDIIFKNGECLHGSQQYSYLGCYIDRSVRALPDHQYNSVSLTTESCISHCQSYGSRYAGTQYYHECFCGSDGVSYDRYGQAPEAHCNRPCRGDRSQMCGGSWRMSVYDLWVTTATPPADLDPVSWDVGSCDFEPSDDPLCGYQQVEGDDFDWTLNSGNTSSFETGPSNDHTFRTTEGHYMYIESSLPNRPGKKARLLSPVIEGSIEVMCIQFYYHMKGDGIGILTVIRKAVGIVDKQLAMIKGHQGDAWKVEAVEMKPFNSKFQLIFEASVDMIPYGDIAIDDIIILRQPCGGHLKESSCSFDNVGDWCGYKQSDEDDLDWEWYNHNVKNPPIDSPGERSYLFLTSPSTSPTKHIATLESHVIDGYTNQHCVELDYFLPQNSTSTTMTVAIQAHNGTESNILTLVADEDMQGWQHCRTNLDSSNVGEQFKVIFIGILGDKPGVIGLDNPTVTQGSCEDERTTSEPKQTNSLLTNTNSNTTSSVVIVFTGLSTLLSVALLMVFISHTSQKYKEKLSRHFPRCVIYEKNAKATGESLTIDNPLYGSEPTVVATSVIVDGESPPTNGSTTNGAHI